MPSYDFRCVKCKKKFNRTMAIAEYEAKKYKCPKCGSAKLEQLVTGFLTVTSKKS